jgi:hypothetical protein
MVSGVNSAVGAAGDNAVSRASFFAGSAIAKRGLARQAAIKTIRPSRDMSLSLEIFSCQGDHPNLELRAKSNRYRVGGQ